MTIQIKLILALVVGLVVLSVWTFWPRHVAETGKFEHVQPAPEVRTVEKIVERVKYVKVYPPEVKAKLNLPPAVVQDSTEKLTATGKLSAEERDYTLAAVLNTETGDSEIYARPDPLPWIGRGRRGAVGIAYGLKNGQPAAKIYSYQELLRIKNLNAGLRAEADQRGEWWAGATLEYRW